MFKKISSNVPTTSSSCVEKTESNVIAELPYVDVSWHQEFVDQEGGAIHSFEFKIPPAAISKGEFVELGISKKKGRVIDVKHRIWDNIEQGYGGRAHLRHSIRIVLDTRSEDEY